MKISGLDNSDLPQVYELAFEAWKDACAGQSEDFIRTASEFIVRKNYYENEYRYKITEDGTIRAILFGCEQKDENDSLAWAKLQTKGLSDPELVILENQIDYLVKSDDTLAPFLTDRDIKLALFISNKRGYGTIILDHFIKVVRGKGKEKVCLWTDSSCNYQYYPKNGFEEVLSVYNANANSTDQDFRTMFFCKGI